MAKHVWLIVLITLGLCSPVFAGNNPNPMGLLQSTYRYNGAFENPFLMTNRVVKGVVYVSAVELKEIKPDKLFFRGKVSSIASYEVPFTKKGTVEYIMGKGNYVFCSIIKNDGDIIRQGTPIARMNIQLLKEGIKLAKKRKKLAEMGYEHIDRMTKAQENLAKKKIITPFALESSQINLFSTLLQYEATKKETDEILLGNQDPNIYSTKSGLVATVEATPGATVGRGTPAITVMQMDPILVKVSCPAEILGLQHKTTTALVYPIGFNKPYKVTLEVKQDDPNNVYIHVSNRVIMSSKLTSMQKKVPKIFSVFPVKDLLNPNIESFYLSLRAYKKKRKPVLCIPEDTLRYDGSGYYVFRIKGVNIDAELERIPKIFTVEKIPILLGPVTTNMIYGIGNPRRVKSIINDGKIKTGDILVGDAQPSLKDADEATLVGFYWEFYPNQQVKVQIPSLTKPGIYVPVQAVIHQDANEDYVYLVQNGVARLKRVNVIGAYENYCLISGAGIHQGERAIIINNSELFDFLYDGAKVKVISPVDAPEFLGQLHALNFNYQPEEDGAGTKGKSSFNSRSRLKNSRGKSTNLSRILSGRLLDQFSSMF